MSVSGATASLDDARDALREHWGFRDFRPAQGRAVQAVLSGRDALIVMPTGGGKSLCYQVPALLRNGVTVVVSPLISLMKDQVDALQRLGLPATFINSSLPASEARSRLGAAERGEIRLIYVAPERFDSGLFRDWAERVDVSLLAVDEAHCISEWGHDFRPAYARLAGARDLLGNPPVAALTATATGEVRRDIVRQLSLKEPEVLVAGFDRRNLTWRVVQSKNDSQRDRQLTGLLRKRGGSAIVYAATRKNVDALAALLNGVGRRAVGYHAGLEGRERRRIQERFMTGEVPVVVATNAFGMGIDKPDVRTVVHYNMPGTVEAYYQEAGRAGRDGEAADCVLLHAYKDRFTHEFFLEQNYPPRARVQAVFRALRRQADGSGVMELPMSEFARTISEVRGDRQVEAAVRLLETRGIVHGRHADAPDGVRVKLLALPERIRAELGGGDREIELKLLRRLWRLAGRRAVYRGTVIDWRRITSRPDARDRVRSLLDGLAREAFLDWHDLRNRRGVVLTDPEMRHDRLPIDWQALAMRRKREEGKLRQMQSYAYTKACRRRHLLRYFGDAAAPKACDACDNCLKEANGGGHG